MNPEMTESEYLFGALCEGSDVPNRRIPPSSSEGERSADYVAKFGGLDVVVEVKQIDPNPEDINFEKELLEHKHAVSRNITPGVRISGKIRDANAQLQKYSRNGAPTMLAVFDATRSLSYTDPYNVKAGMYGLDAVVFGVPSDLGENPYVTGYKSGGRQTMTEDMNTSISVLSVLFQNEQGIPYLITYHNRFANIPLEPEDLRAVSAHQFRLSEPDGEHMPDWVEV